MRWLQATVGRWGKSLAIRVPMNVERAIGLKEGEAVEIEAIGGALVIRRPAISEERRQAARQAVKEIRRMRPLFSLGDVSIKDLINEGRRWSSSSMRR